MSLPQPAQSAVINLSSQVLTPEELEVLSLGLGFCPDSSYDIFKTIKDLNLFVHKLNLKILHHKPESSTAGSAALMQLSIAECRELRELLLTDADEFTSSPSPLIEAMEALDSLELTSETNVQPLEPLLPFLKDLKIKSTTFPATSSE